jgi:hypothetical protein
MEWREGQAAQLDYLIAELDKALVEIENVEAIMEIRRCRGLVTEAIGFAGGVRAEREVMALEARELRRTSDDGGRRVFDISLTTRRVGHDR